jgi:hypothetical protein
MADRIAQLQLYWIKLAAGEAELSDLTTAQEAMKMLIGQARLSAAVRQQFAQANIFAETLRKDQQSATLVGLLEAHKAMGFSRDIDGRSVRAIMLDEIREASTGSLFFPKVPGGVAPWISSADATAPAFFEALTDDPSDVVLASALKFMAEVGLPVAWAKYIITHDPNGDVIMARVARSTLSASERSRLLILVREAIGGMARAQGEAAYAQVEASGTGEGIPMLSPVQKQPWYKRSEVGMTVVGVVGFLVGGTLYRRHRKTV